MLQKLGGAQWAGSSTHPTPSISTGLQKS
jgi:hypothetical protein